MICNIVILLTTHLSQKLNTDGIRVISNHYKIFFFFFPVHISPYNYTPFRKLKGFFG